MRACDAAVRAENGWSVIELLREGTDRIYGFAGVEPAWDGRWLVLTVGTPENERTLRQRLRTRLGWAGLGSVNGTTWVSPRVDREPEARRGRQLHAGDEVLVGDEALRVA